MELKAVSLALQGFLPLLRGHPTLVRSDSLTVVAYINHQGGTHSVPLCLETHSRVSPKTISRWIVKAISSAGPSALVSATPRAHDTHGLSTSWALFNGASVDS